MVMLLVLVLTLILGAPTQAATRLGLFVTQEELTIWKQRMTSGATVNGVPFAQIYQQRLLADANLFRAQSHPGGDGFWVGYTGPGCLWLDLNNGEANEPHGQRFWRGNGADLARSAFVFLLTGDTSYADPVRTELVNQVAQPGTDWANRSKFCLSGEPPSGYSHMTPFEYVPWIYRLLLAYDYLTVGGYTGFSAAEHTAIRQWLTNAAEFFFGMEQWGYSFGCYQGLFETPQNCNPITTGSPCSTPSVLLYFGGPVQAHAMTWFFNQAVLGPMLNAAVGVLTNNATLIANAKKSVTAFLTLGFFDHGASHDFSRWIDCTPYCPGSMWSHLGGAYSGLGIAIDVLARAGDPSLYTLAPVSQAFGTQGNVSMSFRQALVLWAKMANKTVNYYGTTQANDQVPGRLLTWDSDVHNDTFAAAGNYYDFSSMMNNLYYQDPEIEMAMHRTLKGQNSNLSPSGCADQQFGGCFSGTWGYWPDLPYMYGHMAGVVNPYPLGGPLTVSITGPTSLPTYATGSATVALSGTATDDGSVAEVTWVNDRGGAGTAQCQGCPAASVSWTIPLVALQFGANVLTVTVRDDTNQTVTDQLVVTYQLPDVTTALEMHLPLNDGTGTSAVDSTGHGHTGTLSGGATWVADRVGLGAIAFDGVTGQIQVTGLLGSPPALTLAAWVKVTAYSGPDGNEILSLGDYAVLRYDNATTLVGFYATSATTWSNLSAPVQPGTDWHHVAYTAEPGAQRLYFDGMLVAAGSATNVLHWTGLGSQTLIGTHGAGATTYRLQGQVDDVRVYHRVLSSVDIAALQPHVLSRRHWPGQTMGGVAR